MSENKLRGIYRRSILTKSRVEYWDYEINHYAGCGHGCTYPCWAFLLAKRFSELWWGEDHRKETYEQWINAESIKNSIELIDHEIPRLKHRIKRILLCGASDAYQPLERKLGLTRKILERLIEYDIRFTVLTKSSLVLRDLDLFTGYDKCCLGMSITCEPDYMDKERWEPRSSPILDRVKTIKTFHDHGVKTWVSLEPILPHSNPAKLIEILKGHVDWFVFGCLNPKYCRIDKDWYTQTGIKLIELAKNYGLNYHLKREYQKLIWNSAGKRLGTGGRKSVAKTV